MYKNIKWNGIAKMARQNFAGLVFNSELSFDMQVHNVAAGIYNNEQCKIVLIAGPSGSGKTTFTRLLAERLEFMGTKVHRISQDDYFQERVNIPMLPSGVQDFDNVTSMDLPFVKESMNKMLRGEQITLPVYNFHTGKREWGNTLTLEEQDIVLIEGIHALNPLLMEGVECNEHTITKIFIMPRRTFEMPDGTLLEPHELRLLRRLIRDYYTRSHSFERTLKQWEEVQRAEKLYIYPFIDSADYQVDSVYDYELFVYKKCLYSRLEPLDIDKLRDIKRALSYVDEIPIEAIPVQSLINEFATFAK